LTLYGLSTLLWIWLLSRIPLSQAYPWVAIASVIVPLLAWYFYNERMAPVFWVGVTLMLAGLLLTQYGSGNH
jgi:drug/metabolite transporter (DMT)-like permease